MGSKSQLAELFRDSVAPELRKRGFRGRGVHLVRTVESVQQVVELQHSIYGARFTVNFGLDLSFLAPTATWIPRPALGPHAHDCVRWIRLRELLPDKEDRWWAYETAAERKQAVAGLREAVLEHGLSWLEHESPAGRFYVHSKHRLERSKSPRRPYGRFEELRLHCAVCAWMDRWEEAEAALEDCRVEWPDEREHLEDARRHYLSQLGRRAREVPRVPDAIRGLEAFLAACTRDL